MQVNKKAEINYKSELMREHEKLLYAEKKLEKANTRIDIYEKKIAFLEGQVRAYEFVIAKGDIDAIVSFTNPFINNEEEL